MHACNALVELCRLWIGLSQPVCALCLALSVPLAAASPQRAAVLQEVALALAACRSVDLDAQEPASRGGEAALHKAVDMGFTALLDLLIQRRANLNLATTAGQLALHRAMRLAIEAPTADQQRLGIALKLIQGR